MVPEARFELLVVFVLWLVIAAVVLTMVDGIICFPVWVGK